MIAHILSSLALLLSLLATPSASTTMPSPLIWSLSSSTNPVDDDLDGHVVLHTEIAATLRIVETLGAYPENPATTNYVEALREMLLDVNNATAMLTPTTLASLSAALGSTRTHLLDEIEDVRAWIDLSRAIDPDAPLIVPARFIAPPKNDPVEIDVEAIRRSIAVAEHFERLTLTDL